MVNYPKTFNYLITKQTGSTEYYGESEGLGHLPTYDRQFRLSLTREA